ncbi:40S ribosomal protein S0 [Cucumispora dikerogammari]|nr:40S ribosomal protein S0 [Cucumispora dikerogammari]
MASQLKLNENITKALLLATCHNGGIAAKQQMLKYIYAKREVDGINIIDIGKSWQKMIIAASCIASIPNPEEVVVVSCKEFGRKATNRLADLIGATPITGRFIPGSFTNHDIKGVREPRLLVALDTNSDYQTINEASTCNTPVIAFCNTDSELENVDIIIPINNRSPASIATSMYLLANLVRYMKGEINEVDYDLINGIESFMFRSASDLEDIAKAEKEDESTLLKEDL